MADLRSAGCADLSLHLVSLAAMLLLLVPAGRIAAAATEINRIVLRVNDRIATLYEYEGMKQERMQMLSRAQLPEAELQQRLAGLGASVMKEFFDEMLLLSRADQLGLQADESDIRAAIEQTKRNFGITTEEEFDRALTENGMTRELYRSQLEKNILIRQVMGREIYSKIDIEEEDLRRYYQEHPDEFLVPARRLLREVVVLDTGQGAEELEQMARELRALLLRDGADAAVTESEAEGISTGWIDLGWVEAGDLDPQLELALEGLGPGDVSEPTSARGGLHVLQVVDSREAGVQEFADVRDGIEAQMSDQRFQEALAEYMRDLEAKAYIESDPPPEAAGFRSGRTAERARVDLLEGLTGSDVGDESKPAADLESEDVPEGEEQGRSQ